MFSIFCFATLKSQYTMIPVEIKPDYLVLLINSSKAVASITLCWNFEVNNFEDGSYVASRLAKVFLFLSST